MKQIEKLRVLLPHWIEHNDGHAVECRKWSDIARSEGEEKVAQYIDEAVQTMDKVNELLEKALSEAGGASQQGSHHHHHHHH